MPLDVILRDLLNSFSVGITTDAPYIFWIDAAMFALFIIGLVFYGTRNTQHALRITPYALRPTLFAYLALPILTLLAAQITRPLYQNSRYFIAISPAFYIGVAAGIAAISARWKILALAPLAIFLIGAIPSLNNLYFDPRWGKDDHRAWAQDLRERVRPDDVLILNSPHTEELFLYYAREVVPYITLPILRADGAPSPDADRAAVRDMLSKHSRVWYLEMHSPFDDPQGRIEKLFDQEGVLLDQALFRGTSTKIALSQFAREFPTAQARDIPRTTHATFDHLELLGYDAPALVSGKRAIVKLFWQIDEPVGEDYGVSLRVVDEAGTRWAQWDTTPLGNRTGTSTWKPNQIVVDAHDLPVDSRAAPGKYRLQVVVYHSMSGNEIGNADLGEVEITR